MDILVVFDHKYVKPTGVMLRSLIFNNTTQPLNIHAILDKDVDDNDIKSLNELVTSSGVGNFYYYRYNHGNHQTYPCIDGSHLSEAAYFRLFCASILPKDINRILYLDSDMIVNSSLENLWKTDLTDAALAAVVSPGMGSNKDIYINSGLLLINLEYWRENKVEKLFVDYINHNSGSLKWYDQDVLNGVFSNNLKKALPIRYNVREGFLFKKEKLEDGLGCQICELEEALKAPTIIHFSGNIKPWMVGCDNPYRPLFEKYKAMTIWKNTRFIDESIFVVLRRLSRLYIKKILFKLGLIEDFIDRDMISSIQKSINTYLNIREI